MQFGVVAGERSLIVAPLYHAAGAITSFVTVVAGGSLFIHEDYDPAEVVRASYRVLMQKMRSHPDLGGDARGARVLNRAYTILRRAHLRAAYDRELDVVGYEFILQKMEVIADE